MSSADTVQEIMRMATTGRRGDCRPPLHPSHLRALGLHIPSACVCLTVPSVAGLRLASTVCEAREERAGEAPIRANAMVCGVP